MTVLGGIIRFTWLILAALFCLPGKERAGAVASALRILTVPLGFHELPAQVNQSSEQVARAVWRLSSLSGKPHDCSHFHMCGQRLPTPKVSTKGVETEEQDSFPGAQLTQFSTMPDARRPLHEMANESNCAYSIPLRTRCVEVPGRIAQLSWDLHTKTKGSPSCTVGGSVN